MTGGAKSSAPQQSRPQGRQQQAVSRNSAPRREAARAPATNYVPKDLPFSSTDSVIRLPPLYFAHVLDTNSNITKVIVGPETVTRMDHESVVLGPREMIIIPPAHYCIIADPAVKNAKGEYAKDRNGNFQVKFGDKEVRLPQEPFPLFPGESVHTGVTPLMTVAEDCAIRLRAEANIPGHQAGEEWLFVGPATYVPQASVEVVDEISSVLISPGQALRLHANNTCVDVDGVERKAGEEWMVRRVGNYLPNLEETIVGLVDSYILTDVQALHLRAARTFTDVFGKERKAGSEWLVKMTDANVHIPDVYEEVVGLEKQIVLTNRQYCLILDPCNEAGVPQLGQRSRKQGPSAFFLLPGESLESGIQNVYILSAQEALILRAKLSLIHI